MRLLPTGWRIGMTLLVIRQTSYKMEDEDKVARDDQLASGTVVTSRSTD